MASPDNLKLIIEAALLAAGRPLSIDALQDLFTEEELPERKTLREALEELERVPVLDVDRGPTGLEPGQVGRQPVAVGHARQPARRPRGDLRRRRQER